MTSLGNATGLWSPTQVVPPVGPDSRRDGLETAVELASALSSNLRAVVLGNDEALRIAAMAVLAAGHLLVEDVPGVGKTMLAKAIAASIGGRLARVQGHPDLLPSDITGVSVYSPDTGTWSFRAGPVFAEVLLFDELNRTPPRSQSALLEAMEERQVTVDGESWPLPTPHLVLATQNPTGQAGTYPLVESQMDRFLLATHLGYPDAATEARLAVERGTASQLEHLLPIASPATLAVAQEAVQRVHVSDAVAAYAVALVRSTRETPEVILGASPRATISLLAAARASAVLAGRDFVSPRDVKGSAIACLAHRLVLSDDACSSLDASRLVVAGILERVASPRP